MTAQWRFGLQQALRSTPEYEAVHTRTKRRLQQEALAKQHDYDSHTAPVFTRNTNSNLFHLIHEFSQPWTVGTVLMSWCPYDRNTKYLQVRLPEPGRYP